MLEEGGQERPPMPSLLPVPPVPTAAGMNTWWDGPGCSRACPGAASSLEGECARGLFTVKVNAVGDVLRELPTQGRTEIPRGLRQLPFRV